MRARMPRYGPRSLAITVATAALFVASGCERNTPTPGRKDTAVPVAPPPESTVTAAPRASTWDPSAGLALFVAGHSPVDAAVIAPSFTDTLALDTTHFDLGGLRTVQVDLFAGGKQVGTARITGTVPAVRTDSCWSWPTARLTLASDTLSVPAWSVGFEAGHATGVPLDSIEGLASLDSARLAADVARIASALPGDTVAAFRGLPFVVREAWRIRSPSIGHDVLAAIVVRNVNQEANPLQERLLVVAERDTTSARRYVPMYSERVAGPEETLETTDLIATVLLGAAHRPTIVVARDTGAGSSYVLIERVDGRWRRRWVSAYAGC